MANKSSRFRRIREGAQALWEERGIGTEGYGSKAHKFAHFWITVWRSFTRNRCPVRASALAYATLLTLIPMLAVVMSITSTFLKKEGEERIDQFIGKMIGSLTTEAKPVAAISPEQDQNQIMTAEGQSAAPESEQKTASTTETNTNATEDATVTNQNALSAYAKAEEGVKARKAM